MHEQRGDATGVALTRVAQAAVQVAVEEELDDREALVAPGCRLRRELVVEGGLCRGSHLCRLGVVTPDPEEQPGGRRPGHEPHRLHQARASPGVALGRKHGGQGVVDGIRKGDRPRLEGALRQHPGEATVGDVPDQPRETRDVGNHPTEGLDGVLGDVRTVVVEQGHEMTCSLRTTLRTEGAHRRDRRHRVGVAGTGDEHVDVAAADGPRDDLESLAGPHPLEEGG